MADSKRKVVGMHESKLNFYEDKARGEAKKRVVDKMKMKKFMSDLESYGKNYNPDYSQPHKPMSSGYKLKSHGTGIESK